MMRMLRWGMFLCSVLLVIPGAAQSVGTCEPGLASDTLRQADVRASLYNNGSFFWNGGNAVYEVPRDSSTRAIFTASLWFGGQVDGELRFAGADYSHWEFWPGPLPAEDRPPTPDECLAFDRLWRVTLSDIAEYNATGTATADLSEWPVEAGAPVVDGDGDPANYDLAAGDRPAILGDETVWWVMNDRGNEHQWGNTPPMGLEVAVTAYTVSAPMAFERIGRTRVEAEHIGHATFYRLAVTYQGGGMTPAPLESAYVGLYVDPDLGDAGDDYIGSDPSAEVGYVYNGDSFDGGDRGYGDRPAALGAVMLDGPAEKPLSSFVFWSGGGSPQGNPANAIEAYQYMQALWRDGRPIEFGGNGRDGTNGMPTLYMYPDLPPSYWSEYNPGYGDGISNSPSDRRFFISHGPFTMQPGETATVEFAFAWARTLKETLVPQNLASLNRLLIEAVPAVTWLRGLGPDPALATITPDLLPQPLPPLPEPLPELPERYALAASAYPNPTTGAATIRYDLPEVAAVRLVVYDVLGREVAVLVDEAEQAAGFHTVEVDASGWASGAYVYHIEAGRLRGSGRLTRIQPQAPRMTN